MSPNAGLIIGALVALAVLGGLLLLALLAGLVWLRRRRHNQRSQGEDSPASSPLAAPPPPQTAPRGAQRAPAPVVKQINLSHFDELEEDARRVLVGQVLALVGTTLGMEGARVKPRPDDEETDLRGRLEGRPVRVEVSDNGWIGVSVKQKSGILALSLSWDPEKLAKEAEEDDDWSDQDELRVFVGPGVFLEGDKDSIDEGLAQLDQIAPPERSRLVAAMAEHRLYVLVIALEEVSVRSQPNLQDLPDPVSGLAQVVRAACSFAAISGAVAAPAEEDDGEGGFTAFPAQAAHQPTTRCTYCTALYVAREPFRCPNCGAPMA